MNMFLNLLVISIPTLEHPFQIKPNCVSNYYLLFPIITFIIIVIIIIFIIIIVIIIIPVFITV